MKIIEFIKEKKTPLVISLCTCQQILWRDSCTKGVLLKTTFMCQKYLSSSSVPVNSHTHKICRARSLTTPSERVIKQFLFHMCSERGMGKPRTSVHSFTPMLWKRKLLGMSRASPSSAKQARKPYVQSASLHFQRPALEAKSQRYRSPGWFRLRGGTRGSGGRGGGGGSSERRLRALPPPGGVRARCGGSPLEPAGSDGQLLTSDGPSSGLCQENGEGFASSEDPCPHHSLH